MTWRARLYRYAPGIVIMLFVTYAIFNTVMNNAYEYGATFFDSAEFATVIWRSGLTLYMGQGFDGSIFTTHASTINYIPDALSYLWPGDRMDYYGVVYAVLYAAIVWCAYILLLPLFAGCLQPWLAALGAFMLFCGQAMYEGAWEMRSDFAAPLFLMLTFRAWQLRRYRWVVLWVILTCMVREDLGIMLLLPVGLLAFLQYRAHRAEDLQLARERLRWGIGIGALSLLWALATMYVQKHYFPVYDLLQDQYYDRTHPFGHLSMALIGQRLSYLAHSAQGIWLPVIAVALAACVWRDWPLLVGPLAFMPYAVGMFFSKSEMSAQFSSYKAFLLVLPVMWPSIMACGDAARRRRYAILQCVVLLLGLAFIIQPGVIQWTQYRWFPQPMAAHAQLYRDYGEKQLPHEHFYPGPLRVSAGIFALYPYQFPSYWDSWIAAMRPSDADKVETLIWFAGDRDQQQIDAVLKTGRFAVRGVEGTKIRIATRHHSRYGFYPLTGGQ